MTRISCDEARAQMMRTLGDGDGEAAPPALEEHLAACAACAEAWQAQRSVHALLACREPEPMPAGFAARLDAAIDDARPWWAQFDWRWWTLRVAPLSAALLLLVVGAAVRGTLVSSSSTTVAPSTVSTALWDDASTVSSDSLLLAVLSGSPDDTVTRYEGSTR
jgi:anti-sigma factor RsiW